MKIALFAEGYDPFVNGVVTSIKTLRHALEEQGHEVVIFAPDYPGLDDGDKRVVRLPSLRWAKEAYPCLSPFAGSPDVVAGRGFDLIHSHHPFTMSRLAERLAAKHGLPLIYSFHTMLHEFGQYVPVLGAIGSRWLTARVRKHCNRVDRVVVATEVVRCFLQSQGVTTAITVVPEGVPPQIPTPGAREGVRRRLALPVGTPLLLYAGRLAKEKQLHFLVRCFSRLAVTHDVHLCLVGGGPQEQSLRAQAQRLGIPDRVIFCGWVAHGHIADYYAAADIFVFPSTADALGIALVEAMSVGLPCVAINKYGPSEVVIDGLTGFLTPFDEDAFCRAIRRMLDDPALRQRMSEAARRRARDFDPGAATARLVEVYGSAIAERPARCTVSARRAVKGEVTP
jgi:1,2-diacylglycerol 3-alpha-glucosyltransferase